ncbi:MAG: hypothetical protein LBF70_01165 [Holosporales bacterium]|jgi:hypothetical protein|nr:hypothetical protein [Holosporales bacterium]
MAKECCMNIKELHNQAMEIADLADLQKMQGNKNEAFSLYEQSYDIEYRAAIKAYTDNVGEPPVEIAEELRDLLENVHFFRHENVSVENRSLSNCCKIWITKYYR